MTMPERESGNAAAEVRGAGSAIGAPGGQADRKCEICASSAAEFLYRLPCYDGPYTDATSEECRSFWKCANCGFVFTTGYDPKLYESYYSALPEDYHRLHDIDRSRYELIRRELNGHGSLRILDYGCGNGEFLSSLPSAYEKYGVEVSERAAAEARRRGIRVLPPNDLRKPELRRSFDVVVSIDVVEHVSGLSELRNHFRDSLRDGGLLLLLTGNAEGRAARKAGRYWYYHQYAEHVSFLGERSARIWLESEFQEISFQEISHHPPTFNEKFGSLAKFPIAWTLEKAGLIHHLRRFPKLYPPCDHFLVSARRRLSNGGSTG